MTTHKTFCRNCGALCGLDVTVESGEITQIRGDRGHAVTDGYFCIKGQATRDFHNGEDRLVHTKRRNANGGFDVIDTQQGLDEIHAKLSAIIAEYGPASVALYYGTGANMNTLSVPAAKAWADAIGTPYIFSSMTLDQSAKWVCAGRMGMFSTGKYPMEDADVLMIVGSNPLQSHTGIGLPAANPRKQILEARERGTKIIVVDPRETELAQIADLHLPIRPGGDGFLLAGLIRIVLENGWADHAFCNRFVNSLDRLEEAVADFTPDFVEARTGISADLLREAAQMFATARKKSVTSGTGPNMSRHSNVAEHLIEALNAVCGGYLTAGDRVRNAGYHKIGAPSKERIFAAQRSWESGPKLRTEDIGPISGEYPSSRLPAEIAGNSKGRIRALIQLGGNLANALPEPDRSMPMLRELDLMVSVDIRETASGRLADYQVPTTAHYERYDLSLAYPALVQKKFAQVAEPFMDRPDGVIDDWQFFHGLAQRSGLTLNMRRPLFGVAHRHIPGPEIALTPDITSEDLIAWILDSGPSNLEELRLYPGGKEFDEPDAIVQAASEDYDVRLELCPDDVFAEIRELHESTDDTPGYPFRLICRRLIETMNSAFSNAAQIRRRFPTTPIFMNAEDMAKLRLREGDVAKVSARHDGTVIGAVREDETLPAGVIAIPHAWGEPERPAEDQLDAFSGRLVALDSELEAINFMPRQSGVPVRIERCEETVTAS